MKKLISMGLLPLLLSSCITVTSDDPRIQKWFDDIKENHEEAKGKAFMEKEVLPHVAGFYSGLHEYNRDLLTVVFAIDKEGYTQVYFPYATYFEHKYAKDKKACTQHYQARSFREGFLLFNLLPQQSNCVGELNLDGNEIKLEPKKNSSLVLRINSFKIDLQRYEQMDVLKQDLEKKYQKALQEKIIKDKKDEEERIQREKEEAEARQRYLARKAAEYARFGGSGGGVYRMEQQFDNTSVYTVICNNNGFGNVRYDKHFEHYCAVPVEGLNVENKCGNFRFSAGAAYLCQ